jgi:IclR family transcriptional regulator, acetate operon repressor
MSPATASATDNGARGTSVIVNVLQVIRCFTSDEPLQGVTEIAAQVGLHKSSVSRILATLEQEHVVERDETSRKYRLGLGLIAVAGPLLANLDVRRIAMEDLQALRELTEETVALAIWDGSAAVTVEQVPSPQKIKHTSALGSRYTTGLSASVQVPLAYMDPDHVRHLLDTCPVRLDGDITPDQYLQRLADVRRDGHAVNYGETSCDEVGVAAPVFDHRGKVVATLLVAAPRYRVPESALPRLTRACTDAARRVSQRLGSSLG